MPHRDKQIAIITADTLRYLGIYHLLVSYFAPVEITGYGCFDSFAGDRADGYDYYFTDPEIFVLNADFFLPRKNKTIVWVGCDGSAAALSSFSYFLPVSAPVDTMIERLQGIFASESAAVPGEGSKELSGREIEVLQLIVKGAINKEIADRLSISLNTVLSHRKNIMAKLGIKTVSGLTFYALMNGYISADDIEL